MSKDDRDTYPKTVFDIGQSDDAPTGISSEEEAFAELLKTQAKERKKTIRLMLIVLPTIFILGTLVFLAIAQIPEPVYKVKQVSPSKEVCKCICKCPPCQRSSK